MILLIFYGLSRYDANLKHMVFSLIFAHLFRLSLHYLFNRYSATTAWNSTIGLSTTLHPPTAFTCGFPAPTLPNKTAKPNELFVRK